MNNKLDILRERFKNLSYKIFKKTFSKKDFDICMNNMKVGHSGDKASFEFKPENITTYNASIDTLFVLLIRLSNNHEFDLPNREYIKKQYYILYPNTKGFKKKTLDRPRKKSTIERSENTYIPMPTITMPVAAPAPPQVTVSAPQEQQSILVTNDNWTMALNLIKDLTTANMSSKDNEIKYLRHVIASGNTFTNAAHIAAAAVDTIDTTQVVNAANILLNLS